MSENSFIVFFEISIAAIFIQNFVLSRFLGLCPFFGVSKKIIDRSRNGTCRNVRNGDFDVIYLVV